MFGKGLWIFRKRLSDCNYKTLVKNDTYFWWWKKCSWKIVWLKFQYVNLPPTSISRRMKMRSLANFYRFNIFSIFCSRSCVCMHSVRHILPGITLFLWDNFETISPEKSILCSSEFYFWDPFFHSPGLQFFFTIRLPGACKFGWKVFLRFWNASNSSYIQNSYRSSTWTKKKKKVFSLSDNGVI